MAYVASDLVNYGFESFVIGGESWSVGAERYNRRGNQWTGWNSSRGSVGSCGVVGNRYKTGSKRRRNSYSEAKAMILEVAQVTRSETRK